jgi:multidrug efflux pump subunit AcrB
VREVSIAGVREREIRVELDMQRVAAYQIPLGMVMARIAEENSTISVGNIEFSGSKLQVRVPGEYILPGEIRDILLVMRDGKPVYLRDVATVRDTYKDLSSISRLDGHTCVSVNVKKRSAVNSVALIDEVKEITANYEMPPGLVLTEVMDESQDVRMMVGELENNIVTGFILVIVVLVMFMGWRNSLFVAVAMPLSMLITFIVISLQGHTLNMIVLFSLVLAVGMLVDNAIVIVENIYRNRCLGLSRLEAARKGASEVAWPVVTSTLTTLMAFAPLMFWPDIMGQFMGYLPRTLIITLSASLFVGLVINPAVCSYLIQGDPRKYEAAKKKGDHPFMRRYESFLRASLNNSGSVIVLGMLFLVFTLLLFGLLSRGMELFPEIDPRNAQVSVKFPQGTAIERTDEALSEVEALLLESTNGYDDVQYVLATVGGSGPAAMFPGQQGGVNSGTVHVEFKKWHERTGSTSNLVSLIRKRVPKRPGAEVNVDVTEEGPPTGAPVSIEFSGDDFSVLSDYSTRLIDAVRTVPGVVDVRSDFEEALPELQVVIDRQKAAVTGLDTSQIGLYLRTAIYGTEASKYRADEDEHEITIRFPETQRDSVDMRKEMFVPTVSGGTVPLSTVATFEYRAGLGVITRKNQKRLVTITGNVESRPLNQVLADVAQVVGGVDLPKGYAVRYGGENEEMVKSMRFLSRAFLFAVSLIAIILVIQFNSVLLPLIIMFTVLLSMIGVFWGLMLCGLRFGVIMTMLGVISLAGIVVNNAIVLIDCIRQRKADGLDSTEAIVAAGKMRLRPVLLTAVTTILGLIPMAIGYSLEVHSFPPKIVSGAESSAWWAPMAVAVIFGLGFATILTLLLVPSMVSVADRIDAWFRKKFHADR